ncbi:MFS transporter [Francisella halioticida]|uniref:MFS transporter n=1 Tax=Francisella halioticida TaxID=549298 RepID=UPI001AF179AD|nr:MFS transporter [Francisella halioticida]BCD90942.1 MFS transporter [Francisella halioticida]
MRYFLIGWIYIIYEYALRLSDSVILINLQDEYHLSSNHLASLSSAYYFAYIGLMIPASILIDRFGLFKTWVAAMGILIIGCVMFAFAPNLEILIIARILMGIGSAFAIIGIFALSVENVKHSGTLIGLTMLMAMIGALIGQGPWLQLTKYLGDWRETYLLAAVFGMVLVCVWSVFCRDAKSLTETKSLSNILGDLKCLIKSPLFWIVAIFMGCLSTPQTAFLALWGPIYLQKVYDIDATQAAYLVSIITIGGLFGAIFFGWLSDKLVNIKHLLVLCGFVTAGLFMLLIDGTFSSEVILIFVLFLIGAITNANTMIFAFLGRKFNNFPKASVQGSANTLNMGGGPVMQILIGLIMSLQTSNITNQLSLPVMKNSMYAIPIALAIFSLILIVLPKEKFITIKS